MSLTSRPYVGTWEMRNQTIVRHTPDCIVMVNGFREFATCPSCAKPIDLQKYITSVSVDATTDPISTANFSLKIPRHATDVFSHDGNYVLQPNLEVIIILRGYFPMKGYAGKGQDDAEAADFNANDVPVYPYYQVFRGVTTEVNHEFSGGFYSASVQCANLLHFWQNLHVSVNGSVFGRRPSNSMVEPHLIGHKFTGANPYSIIYTLVKVGFGAAYGVDFTFSQESNIRATDDDNRTSLYAHAAEWWEKRWTEHSGNLRMYGINGRVFNAFEQAYLGRWFDTRTSSGKTNAFYQTAKRIYDAFGGGSDYDLNRNEEMLLRARELGWDPYATNASIVANTNTSGEFKNFVTEDILRMQAFTLDIGKMGNVNLFETEYMSKLEVAEAVKTITGYEFYQDVDGDLVFKPPMYNMDTSSDPVYRISDRDLISLSETESEPEVTIMKGTGSHFANITGAGVDGWLGVGGVFIDYRLVAKYGYREGTFETNYLTNRQAIFVSAINRLDLANAGTKTASITIPIRPELRPGYPIYVETLDCFFYVKSLSHSFSFGGQCTTTINGIAKRAKFLPPLAPSNDRKLPSISQVRLDAPDQYPSLPLYGYPAKMAGDDVEGNSASGPPRIYGFPNVILALDPDKINLDTVDLDRNILSAEAYVQIALTHGFLERGDEENTFKLRSSNEGDQPIYLSEIQQEWNDAAAAIEAGEQISNPSGTLGQILQFIDRRLGGVDTPDVKNLVNYLALQTALKSTFSPGSTIAGKYRYYSSNHPDPAHQAPPNLIVDQEAGTLSTNSEGAPSEGFETQVYVFRDAGNGKGLKQVKESVGRSVRIAGFSKKAKDDNRRGIDAEIVTQNVATSDIRFVTFGPQITRKLFQVSEVRSGWPTGTNFLLHPTETRNAFGSLLGARAISDPSLSVAERFFDEYSRIFLTITAYATELGVDGVAAVLSKARKVEDVTKGLRFASGLDASKTAQALYPRKQGDPLMVRALSSELAEALYSLASDVTNAAIRQIGSNLNSESYNDAMILRAKWISNYTNGLARPNDAEPGRTFFFSPEYRNTASWTPIFPVSDGAGYEVYGNLPYGRGVDIERYADLLQTTNSGPNSDSAATDSEESVTLVGTSGGSNASSLDAIERFFVSYLLVTDPKNPPLIGPDGNRITTGQGIYNANDPATQAAILAYLNTTADGIDAAVEQLFLQNKSKNAKVRNSPVTSFFRGQSVFGDVAAANLANLDVEGVICHCKGVEADIFLSAFSEEFLDRYPDDPLTGYLDERTATQTLDYQTARDAMSGQTMDLRFTTLAEQFQIEGNRLSQNLRGLAEGIANLGEEDE